MKFLKLIFIIILIGGAVWWVTNLSQRKSKQVPDSPSPPPDKESISRYPTKIDEQGQITVKATPLDVDTQSPSWKFQIALDTHSVELDYDLIDAVSLFNEQGNEYKAMSWEGSSPGGHHREGILTFKAIEPAPKELKIEMFDIGGIEVRTFTWQLIDK